MRKALIGLLITATAVTPLASAEAQGWRGGRDQARSEQRSERQEQRQERREQRVEQRQERSFARPQNNEVARNWQGRQGGEARNVERQVSQQQAWQGRADRGDRGNRQQAWQGRVERPAQQQYAQQNWRDRNDRRDQRQSDARRWDGNRNSNFDRNRAGNWDRNRNGNWNRNRSSRDWSRSWNRNWRNDNRYDWQRYRYSNRSIFRGGRYYAPYRDYRYSRFSIGFFLEPLFYSSRYWIGDPWQYRLPPAYPGTHWVRYYNDVLLVDTYSGEVVDVIYDFFY